MTQASYTLHYAPDNASLVIRLALEETGVVYRTQLVDRRVSAQHTPAYRALNPNGLIPVLETPQGPMFETAAILLWLCDQHGGLGPQVDDQHRADSLKWLFFLSNTLHPALRMLFYPAQYIGDTTEDQAQLARVTQASVQGYLRLLDTRWHQGAPGLMHTLYFGPMLRWLALYPRHSDKCWFKLADYPALLAAMQDLENRPSVLTAQHAEGLGPTPFTAPQPPSPPEGSAL